MPASNICRTCSNPIKHKTKVNRWQTMNKTPWAAAWRNRE